jgi:glycosyltransferase involved in cell wall biosynthesis
MKPLVSVITPTYNHERFIGPCIESVLAQSYDNWEMIIVDDGSTDHTWDMVQTYLARDTRIRAFRQENKGIWRLAETYNFALEQSHGELIAVLEGDDLWIASKLATQVPFHTLGRYAISFGQIQYIDVLGRFISQEAYPDVRRAPFLNNPDPRDLFIRLIRSEYFIPAVTAMVSREHLTQLGGFQQPGYLPLVDYPTWLHIGANSGNFGFIREIIGYWRKFSGQTTWLHARDIAGGEYQFTLELIERKQLDLGVPVDELQQYLLSPNRREFLADSSYRAAAAAFETGANTRAWHYCIETAQLGNYRLFTKCLAMFTWKFVRRLAKSVRPNTVSTTR